MAQNPRIANNFESPLAPTASKAPTMVMPEIALEPDISGVCNVGETLVIISKPTKIAKTNIVIVSLLFFVTC